MNAVSRPLIVWIYLIQLLQENGIEVHHDGPSRPFFFSYVDVEATPTSSSLDGRSCGSAPP